MADTLYSMLTFTGIPIGGTQTLPHNLSCNGVALKPDWVLLQFMNDFEFVAATTTTLTIRNTANTTGDCLALCHAIHPVERSFGMFPNDGTFTQHLTPQPFVPGSPNTTTGGGGPFEVVVFQPGGASSQNVFATWPEVMTALGELQGTRILQFDRLFENPIIIPAGSYDMAGVIWAGFPDKLVNVEIHEGTTLTNLRAFTDRLQVVFTGSTPPIADFSDGLATIDLLTIDNGATLKSTGSGPMCNIAAAQVQINLGNQAGILFGAHAVINVASGTTSLFVQGAEAELDNSAISGAVGATLAITLATSSPAVFGDAQAAFLGTLTLTNASRTFNFPSAPLTGNTVLSASATGAMVLVDPSGGAFAVTLPAAAGLRGQAVLIKNTTTSANNVTITAGAGDNIDGAATAVLAASKFSFRVTSDGVHTWYITT